MYWENSDDSGVEIVKKAMPLKRYSKKQTKILMVPQPQMLYQYNQNMGGVDLADNGIANYRISIKAKKWYWPLFTNFISMCVVNSWKLVNTSHGNNKDLLEHRRQIVSYLIKQTKLPSVKIKSSISLNFKINMCNNPTMISDPNHKRLRCANSTLYYCCSCNTRLHSKCFMKI